MGTKGVNKKSFAFYEELPYRASPESNKVAIYKRHHTQKHLPLEERSYYIHIPVQGTKGGVRKSLGIANRAEAILKAEEMAFEAKSDLRGGISLVPVPVENLVEKFLLFKKSRVREAWQGKKDMGKKSITQERYILIRGKLNNYFLKFLGRKTDVRSVPDKRWDDWESWRRANNTRPELGNPKAVTIQNEMVMIREIWNWGMKKGLIPAKPYLPFEDEDLVSDDKVSRDTWDANEWNSFKGSLIHWLKKQENKSDEIVWDCFVSYQMLFVLANSGIRVGECMKLKRKDVKFRLLKNAPAKYQEGKLSCLLQIHKSGKTGEREVNAFCGEFVKRVWDKSKYKDNEDFLFCHLDGKPFTTKQFRKYFYQMTAFSNQDEKWGKRFQPYSIRHFYATTRLQNGTSRTAICENLGVTEPYLRKHYSKYKTRLATADLFKVNEALDVETLDVRGDDFFVPDVEIQQSYAV